MLLPLCLPWVYFLVTTWIFISVWCPALFMRLVMWGLTGSGFSQIFFLRLCHLRFLIVVKYTQAPLPLAQCSPLPFRASLHPRRTPGHPPPARSPVSPPCPYIREHLLQGAPREPQARVQPLHTAVLSCSSRGSCRNDLPCDACAPLW